MHSDWVSAFDRCKAPYREWANRRAQKQGLIIVERFGFNHDGEEVSTDGPPDSHQGWGVILRQDIDKAAEEISSSARVDPISFDAACLIVARQIKNTGVVPGALRDWTVDVLTGALSRPTAKGKIANATAARDKLIYRLIQDVILTLRLHPTSSNRDDGKSACHAVAKGFALLGLEPCSYQAMVKIWEKRENLSSFSSLDD